jgi:hypothetical protein
MTVRRGGLALRLPCFARPILFPFRKGALPAAVGAKKRRNWQVSDLPSADRPAFRRLCGLATLSPPWRMRANPLFWKLESYFFSRKGAETCLPWRTGRKEITVRWANEFSRTLTFIVKTKKWLFLKHLIVLI